MGKQTDSCRCGYIYFPTQRNGLSTTVYANGPPTCRNLHISGIRPNCASRYSGRRGAGKTQVLKAIVKMEREIFGCDDSVFSAAHTGAAASNVGRGATTLASL